MLYTFLLDCLFFIVLSIILYTAVLWHGQKTKFNHLLSQTRICGVLYWKRIMSKKNEIILQFSNIFLCVAIILLTAFFMQSWSILVQVCFFGVAALGLVAEIVFLFIKKEFLVKLTFIVELIAAVLLVIFVLLGVFANLNNYPTDEEKIEAVISLIRSTGKWGMLVFVMIQILQVVVLPLPAIVCYVPGAIIWSPLTATLLASTGVIIGSMICYFLGRKFGRKALIWLAGKDATEKYADYIGNRSKGIFLIMQIVPFFPDDILCIIAGLTAMNFPYFAGVIVLVRPLIIAAYCFFGNGSIIPFEGWGIPVWIAIALVFAALAFLSFKYQKKFEDWLFAKFSKKRNNKATSDDAHAQTDNGETDAALDSKQSSTKDNADG